MCVCVLFLLRGFQSVMMNPLRAKGPESSKRRYIFLPSPFPPFLSPFPSGMEHLFPVKSCANPMNG